MESTVYHAKYYAHDLTRRCASDSYQLKSAFAQFILEGLGETKL